MAKKPRFWQNHLLYIYAATKQLNISRGCLRNILLNEKALQSEGSLLEESDHKRQHYGNDQEVEEGFSNF